MEHDADRQPTLRRRKMIERKLGEVKKCHGMRRAWYRGKTRAAIQILITFLMINAKRVLKLIEERKISVG